MQRCFLFIFLFLCAHLCEAFYNGQDITRPVNRLDIRLKVQEGVDKVKGSNAIITGRTDLLQTFNDGWQAAVRIDVPYEWFYCPHNARQCNSPYCYDSQRTGDSLLQLLVVTPDYDEWSFGAGCRFIFPSAGNNLEIGQGKYQAEPCLAFRQYLTRVNLESYWGVILRHSFDYAGFLSAPHISQTYIQPFINISLIDDWFINSSPEMIYNWKTSKWFIPFDLMAGKMITEKWIVSLEYESGIVQDYPEYSQEVEFRIGYFY